MLAVAGLAGLAKGLSSSPDREETGPRPISAAEAGQLAQVRLHNWQDAKAGIAGSVADKSGKQIRFDGWIDWRRPLLSIRTAPRQGMGELLIQAVPGIVAIHATKAGEVGGGSKPPVVPPVGNWRLRPLGLALPKDPDPMDALFGLLFALTSTTADDADLLRQTDSQWLRTDSADGTEVNVILGPAIMPRPAPTPRPSPTPTRSSKPITSAGTTKTQPSKSSRPVAKTKSGPQDDVPATPRLEATQVPAATTIPLDPRSLRAHGGAVAYWLAAGARLEKLETYLSPTVSATIDIDRTQHQDLTAVPAFGGATITPRAVSASEAKALAEMRRRTLAQQGGQLTITMPMAPARMVNADGWIDFRKGVAYAIAHDMDDAKRDVLLHASHTKTSLRQVTGTSPEHAPLPAPATKWESRGWGQLTDATELEVLLHEVLSIGVDVRDNAKDLAKRSNRLRLDEIGGRQVAVFEIRGAGEPKGVPGSATFRYWVDPTGVVHRVEIRTPLGFARLDIDYGKIPALPARV